MIVNAGYSKWKTASTCRVFCRPFRCMAALIMRADTAPTEFSIAAFITLYGARMLMGGVGHWDTAEYILVSSMGIGVSVWPMILVTAGLGQFISLFSSYPNTVWSRAYRVAMTAFTATLLTFLSLARWLQAPHEPGWIPFAGLACGGLWIFVRTRRIR